MVEFVSFILGLTIGVKPVKVAVDETVAAVEIRLDGASIGTITGPPWYLAVPFGRQLEPRLLEAFAVDAEGREVDRARLVVNYGLMNYQAVLVLDTAREGAPRTGRVVWDAILDRRPRRINLTFDERRVPVDSRGRFQLPSHDPEALHFLVAEVSFPRGESARAELDFGGIAGDRVTSALTALPLLVPAGTQLPTPEQMQGWFEKDGEPLRPFSTAASDLHLLVVRDATLPGEVEKTVRELKRSGKLPPEPNLDGDDSIRFVATRRPANGAFRAEQPRRSKMRSNVWELMAKYRPDEDGNGRREIWTTLAAAARFAADGDRRRAVVFLAGKRAADRSSLNAAQAVGYLRSVRVPHFLWAPSAGDLPGLEGLDANAYFGAEGLEALVTDLSESLRGQRMVWIEGLHFPQQVSLTNEAPEGFRLAE